MKVHYVFAIEPPTSVTSQLEEVRKSLAHRHGDTYTKPHRLIIKMSQPFLADEAFETENEQVLKDFARSFHRFEAGLRGFNFAEKQRLIAVQVEKSQMLELINFGITAMFKTKFLNVSLPVKGPFMPYISLSARHEDRGDARYAYEDVAETPLLAKFPVTELYLLKREAKQWVQVQTYSLGGS